MTSTEAAALQATSTPTGGDVGVQALSLGCDTSQSNLYCVYTVNTGDTLFSIAQKFSIKGNLEEDVTPWEMLIHSNRPDIAGEDDLLQPGQKIRIPLQNGIVHTVLSAQTLTEIAVQYNVPSDSIMAVTANSISDANSLAIGQEILVVNPRSLTAPAPVVVASGGVAAAITAAPSSVPAGPRSNAGFIWPAGGSISSYFTASHPLGIDIDFFANPNQPVGAVAAGTVTFAGGNACCSYGYYVIVDHGGGIQTLYAHFSQLSVSAGQRVSQGQVVGLGGRTGYATGNHLHFEVHVGGAAVNPLTYLP